MDNTSSFSWPNSLHKLLPCRFLSLLPILRLLDVLGHGPRPNTHIWAFIPTIAPQNSTLLLLEKKKGDFDSLMTTLITLMSFFLCRCLFNCKEVRFWRFGIWGASAFISCGAMFPMFYDVMEILRWKILLGFGRELSHLLFLFICIYIYIYILLKDFSCSTFCIFNSKKLVRVAILHFRKLPLALLFKFRTFSSSASLISPRHPHTFNYFKWVDLLI